MEQSDPSMSRAPSFWRRRRFIIDRSFQYALVRLLVAVWVFNTALMGWFMYYLYAGPVFNVDHLLREPNVRILAGTPPQFLPLLVLAACFGLFLVIVVGLHLSHQIAGPAYRLKQSMRRVSAGDIDFRVALRRNDYLMDLSDGFNAMLHSLKSQAQEDLDVLTAVESSLPGDSPLRERVEALKEAKRLQVAESRGELEVFLDDAPVGVAPEALASAET